MKIFLDVGAHMGQTLIAAQQADFHRIYCFEPASICWEKLSALADKRTKIERFGLWNKTTEMPLNDPGSKGGSIWIKNNRDPNADSMQELCEFRSATDWFQKNIRKSEQVYLKLNCEGCECDILDDLLDSGEFSKVAYLLVEFDVRKVDSLMHREGEMRDRLSQFPYPRIVFSRDLESGPVHGDRIRNWFKCINL